MAWYARFELRPLEVERLVDEELSALFVLKICSVLPNIFERLRLQNYEPFHIDLDIV